jgi:hypothetical protein
VRIRQLTGWPPSRFQATEVRGIYAPPSVAMLQLQAASLVPSIGPRDAPELFLLFKDPVTEHVCSTRLRMKDPSTAVRVAKVLAPCKNKTIAEIGELEIHEDDRPIPGLRSIL